VEIETLVVRSNGELDADVTESPRLGGRQQRLHEAAVVIERELAKFLLPVLLQGERKMELGRWLRVQQRRTSRDEDEKRNLRLVQQVEVNAAG
jgi:hypothetical protein